MVSINTGLAGGAGFPTAVNPKPLAGMLADNLLEHGVEPASVVSRVAGYLKWGMKF